MCKAQGEGVAPFFVIRTEGLFRRPLGDAEFENFCIRLAYPEKFWKLANYYYNTNKAWIPGKHMEKLEKFLGQQEKRVSFSRELLYNNSNQPRKSGR